MMKKLSLICFLITVFCLSTIFAQDKTVINNSAAKQMLLGKHKVSLQWISWDYFGVANVTERDGVLYLKGKQKQRGGTDFLKIDGIISSIDQKEFKFKGKIVTRVSHINNGETCEREGEMVFAVRGTRRYWRLQQMENPCDAVTDYVDIFFR